ncbi:MAG: stalk domain-containing protein [Firmicutes bacterium]|nr:stalk domain-containing protein [Bacillota bacterium]
MLKKCAALLLTAVFALSLCALAAAAEPAGSPVRVRIESCVAGSYETLLPTTTVYLSNSEDTAYWALYFALAAKTGDAGGALQYETSDYGMYITSIMGHAQDDVSSWMYAVNNETPWVGFDKCVLQSGDSVVFYLIDWQAAAYAYFDEPMVTPDVGEEFTLTLRSNTWDETGLPVEGAAILINGEPSGYVTGADGAVRLSLPEAGTYAISASLRDKAGKETISRPFCEAAAAPAGGAGAVLRVSAEYGAVFLNRTLLDVPVAPYSQGGALYLPLRAVAANLGGVVGWDPDTLTASVRFNGRDYACGVTVPIDGAFPMIVRDRMMVPAKFITDVFGIEVTKNR